METLGSSSVGSLQEFLTWRARLIKLLESGAVSRQMFERLFKEYTEAADRAVKRGSEILSMLEERYKELRALEDSMSSIPASQDVHSKRAELRARIEEVRGEIEFLKFEARSVIGGLESIEELEEVVSEAMKAIPTLVGRGLIPDGLVETVKLGLKRDLDFLREVYRKPEAAEAVVVEPGVRTLPFDEDRLFREVTKVVKGHDDEVWSVIRAMKVGDNVLILGGQGEGKTEFLLQLNRCLGGIYMCCHEEVSERELIAGFNPTAFVGENPVHQGCLMQIALGEVKGLPIAFLDDILKLRPKTQVILFEAMNNRIVRNPIDGKTYRLPRDFLVVSAANLESVTQDIPDPAMLDRFGKIVIWGRTGDDAVREILAQYRVPSDVVELLLWVRREVSRMRYLLPVSVRALVRFAEEYSAYRDVYRDPENLGRLVVDRLVKVRVINTFGMKEFEEASRKVLAYVEENF